MPSRQDLLVRCRKPYIFEAAVSGFLPKLAGKQNSRRTGGQDRNLPGRKNWRQPTRRPASRRRPAKPGKAKVSTTATRGHGCLPLSAPKTLAEKLSCQRARRDRPADGLDRRSPGRQVQAVCGPAGLRLHGKVDQLRRPRTAFGRLRRLAAVEGPRQGGARGDHDAKRAAKPGRDDGHTARRLHGGERQPALHAARARAPAQGFRCRGDRHTGELRQDAAGGDRQDRGQSTSWWRPWATCSASRA